MDSSTSDASPDSSDSSLADSTSADSPVQASPTIGDTQDPTEMASTIDNDHSDSDSDISMSAETDDEEDNGHQRSIIVVNTGSAVMTKKRKYSDSAGHPNGRPRTGMIEEVRKRLKPDDAVQNHWTSEGKLRKDKSLLPPEIWQHIFTFCPARSLGFLMQVNKTFNRYLDPSTTYSPWVPLSKSALLLLSSDSIWRYSRHAINMHGLPTPLSGKSELDMWRLACGSLCQFCGKARQSNLLVDQWHPGPGEKGVTPVWPFGIRSCGPCLLSQSTKEIDLLLSSKIPSPLMAALPFIFLTNELHILSSTALQSGQHPSSLQVTKHFYNLQVEEIKKEFDDVKVMGSATAEEWLKGLDSRGRERRNDAARWERWEASAGIARMLGPGREAPPTNSLSAPPHSNLMRPVTGNLPPHPGNNPLFTTNQSSQLPLSTQNGFATNPPPRYDSPALNGFTQYAPRPPQTKYERTKEEVAELKAARRAEIERRCLLLDPPITAGVLSHMPSFQAAIQIIQPLVDSSWEVLKPRLISQREDAEQRENDRLAQSRVVHERFDERRFQDMQSRSDSKDPVEREWDDMQAPLRARIGAFADEIVRDGWNGGNKVSYETCPLFAAEVLIYVRKRFYAEVAKGEVAIRATGREPEIDPPNGPFTRKLVLENMKWVFDTKIKPYTEPYRKELFLCNACEYANKYYGFEGVIQHFAAKHTSALSVGSVVVHWKSEWPEYPPFNPDPKNAVKPYYPAVPIAAAPYPSGGLTVQQNYGYGGYPVPVSTPMPGPNPHVYQESPGPYYGHPQFGDQYSGHQNGPYAPPPQPYLDPSQAFQQQQYSVAPHAPSVTGYNDAPQDYSPNGYGAPSQPPQDMYANQGQQYLPPTSESHLHQAPYDPPSQYASFNQASSYPPNNLPPTPPKTEHYTAQLQDLARNAREIWNSIGSIKEVPGSLKVYTIIYHILKRFRETHREDPPLSMMVDGLSSNKDMRPVRNVNGLLCKACTLGMPGSLTGSQKKHYSFPQLVNHFHAIHDLGLSQSYAAPLDWTKDMVDLPDNGKLQAVVNAPGMHGQKLAFFTEAVPEIIPAPKPVASGFHHEAHEHYGPYIPQTDYAELAPSQDNHDKYYAPVDNGKSLELENATFDTGEYDPRHPSDLPVDPRRLSKPIRRDRRLRQYDDARDRQSGYRIDKRYEDHIRDEQYAARPERSYIERRPSSSSRAIPAADCGLVVMCEEHPPPPRRVQYEEVLADVEYRVRRNPVLTYDDPDVSHLESQRKAENSKSFNLNGRAQPSVVMYETEVRDHPRPLDEAAVQQSRIYEVVAQISQQAQQAKERQPAKEELADAGSEDGEVQADRGLTARAASLLPPDEASNAAQRFLDNFHPGEISHEAEVPITYQRTNGHEDGARIYRAPVESQRRSRPEYEDDRGFASTRRFANPADDDAARQYTVSDRGPLPRPERSYAYEDRYISTILEQGGRRDRSPELVDRRYKLNNVVYRDERQDGQGTYRTPSRYARYESVRLENDRARSRSPVYVKVGTHAAQFRDSSPGPHPAHSLRQETIYRSRTPQEGAEEYQVERSPRQEYYRVYADEPRPRQPQYAEAFEFVRVSDPAGDYMIRRPVRREPEPIYATYEDDVYASQPVYENRAPAPRAAEPTFDFEDEYDPRHPAPPPPPARQIRYQ